MRTVHRSLMASIVGLTLLSAACSEEPTGPGPMQPTGEVTLLDDAAWPGGSIRFQSADFPEFGDNVTVALGDRDLVVTTVDATTRSAAIPGDFQAGPSAPVVEYAGIEVILPAVQVAGYASSRSLPATAHILWDAYAISANGEPMVIGGTSDGALAIVNLLTGAVVSTPDALDWMRLRGPGMSYLPGIWILRDDGPLTAWQIGATAALAAEQPDFAAGFTRQVGHLAPHRWLTTTSQGWTLHARADENAEWAVAATGNANEPEGVHLSPRGDRATLRVDRITGGVPVFDVTLASVAFTTDFTSVQGVTYSATGSRLVIVGGTGTGIPGEGATPSEIAVLDATTGAVLASRALDLPGFSVAYHPSEAWLLVGAGEGTAGAVRPAVLVLDATTLAPVATLRSPATAPTCSPTGTCLGGVVVADDDDAHVFVSWNGPPHSWRFKLLEP